jgi:hypothetical protein
VRFSVVVALACALAGCGGAPKASSPPPDDVHALNLAVQPGARNAVRIGFAASGPSADVLTTFEPASARMQVCALANADAALPHTTAGTSPSEIACRQIASGVRETVVGRGDLGGIAIVNLSGGVVRADAFVEFDERARTLAVRLPGVPTGGAACQDQGCNPTFELTPVHNGPFAARATWSGGTATLVLLQGSVRGRSATATGIPYREAARSDGAAAASIGAEMSAPGEYALVLRQEPGGSGMRAVRIDATWP